MKGTVISKEKCEWSDMYKLGQTQLCFWALYRNQGTCSGDSGGPLICLDGKKAIITGITKHIYASHGTAYCGKKDVGDVFTNVSYFLLWIQSFMENSTINLVHIRVIKIPFKLLYRRYAMKKPSKPVGVGFINLG